MFHACLTEYEVKHILIECTVLAHTRQSFYRTNEMKKIFQNTEMNDVMSFLKAEYLRGAFNKFPVFFVQEFKIVVVSWKLSMLLRYIL